MNETAAPRPKRHEFDFLLFTDGSGHQDQLGGWCATAVSFLPGSGKRTVMGGANNLTVDRAEMTALIEGLYLVSTLVEEAKLGRHPIVWWYSDRESLVKSMTREYRRKNSQDLWTRIEFFEMRMKIQPHFITRETQWPDFAMCDLHASSMRIIVRDYTENNGIYAKQSNGKSE